MSSIEKTCRVCGETEENTRLERCGVCAKYFCATCSHRAFGGRKFCSPGCARNYYFHGESDDDEDSRVEED